MTSNTTTPKQALNPAFLKQKPTNIEQFKKSFVALLGKINKKESEEHNKNLLKDFLNDAYYKDEYEINVYNDTKNKIRVDFAVSQKGNSFVEMLIEVKNPTNQAEMPSRDNLNKKALQELLLYYMSERVMNQNKLLRHFIVTNMYEWFVFDAADFYALFIDKNKAFLDQFKQYSNRQLEDDKTKYFYEEIARPEIEKLKDKINFVYFNLRDYENQDENDEDFVALYKFLSPTHLLKRDIYNDNNKLNKEFYNELLHILGLTETKSEGKIKIERKAKDRDEGALLELTIAQLEATDISQIKDLNTYGNNHEEQLFGIALSLVITWVNRILFMKLLEAQLLKYHNNHADYAFLLPEKINAFSKLNTLFFQVLAQTSDKRPAHLQEFAQIPYLNSSLFEQSELENETLKISELSNEVFLSLYEKTVLTNKTNDALDYLLQFLNAYNFSGKLEENEDPDKLISAAVLGLIFEKINGYKDGSFFTPSFITMYMCRETIGRAVVQKFNETKGWNCQTIGDLHNHIGKNTEDIQEANRIFNTIRICDPAVGSGHFLVSALNEMIYLKAELGILADKTHKTLNAYQINVENDELTVKHNGEHFQYKPKNAESQRVQETLFHEKQTIIENCLFGVDINPNSVKICQLRLWIELLKNAYYTNYLEPKFSQDSQNYQDVSQKNLENPVNLEKIKVQTLQTLPNIDINIKCGNSLISRFDLHDKYTDNPALLQKIKVNTQRYRTEVFLYKNCNNKEAKRQITKNIENEKAFFYQIKNAKDPDYQKLQKAQGELMQRTFGTFLDFQTEEWQAQTAALTEKVRQLETQYNEKIHGCFEWRFEFPEVLDDDGNFVGFDVVIGNPPYVSIKQNKMYSGYQSFKCFELYAYFFERSFGLLKENALLAFITASLYLKGVKFQSLRDFLEKNFDLINLKNEGDNVFPEVKMPTSVFLGKKGLVNSWNFENMNDDFSLLKKVENNTVSISQISKIMRGLEFGRDKINANGDIPFITGSNVCKYGITKLSFIDKDTLKDYSKDNYFFEGERLLLREIGSIITALYLDNLLYSNRSLYSIKITNDNFDSKFVLACLNSKLLQFYYQTKFKAETELFPKIRIIQAKELPIPNIPLSEQQPIIALVNQILSAKKENPQGDTSELEKEIDSLVYSLYELTEEEIGIMEQV